MSGNMKRLRRTNNPLDRNTRNDINYNWEVLDNTLSNIDTSDFETEQQFNKVDNQIKELEQVDKQLSDRIKKNRDDIDAMDLDLLIEQGNVAEQKGQVAKKQGDKTEEQGNIAEQKGKKTEEQGNLAETKGAKAEQQGDYAKEQGKYANEKAEYAAETTSKIIEANEDLAQTKLDTVEATQKANKSADHAQQAGDKATEQVERVQPIIDRSETALKEVEQATDKANTSADYAKEQGDYAKDTADKVNKAHTDLSKLKEETITATNGANDATVKAIEATDKANTSSEKADEQATRAKEKTDYLETLLPNIEGWEFKGDWETNEEYEKHNIVTFNGSTFILLSDKAERSPADYDGWHMLARRGIDGKGAVQTVNNFTPDLEGNVDLGELATPDDVKDAADKTLETSKEYTDEQISEIPEVDISHLETKEDATAKLEEAKQYTDEAIGDVDLSELEKQINDHSKEIATTDKTGHVQIGKGLDIDKSGILSTKTASKEAIESGVSDDEFITPKGLSESKEEIVKSVEGLVKSVNSKKPTAEGNVDLGELVHSVAGIAPDSTGDVPLTIGDLTLDGYSPPEAQPNDYAKGITAFRTTLAQSNEWHKVVIGGKDNAVRTTVLTIRPHNRYGTTQIAFFYRMGTVSGNSLTVSHIYVRSSYDASNEVAWTQWRALHTDKSSRLDLNSTDFVATSKAVYDLKQEISELRNAIIELGGKL